MPRWKLGYETAGAIEELMPKGIFEIEDYDEFRRRYFDKLDAIGVDRIREKLHRFDELGRPVVLLCFEDIRYKFKAELPSKTKVSQKVSSVQSQLALSLFTAFQLC